MRSQAAAVPYAVHLWGISSLVTFLLTVKSQNTPLLVRALRSLDSIGKNMTQYGGLTGTFVH